jgi:hypothetical protein
MKCERCLSLCGEVAEFRVCTEIINIKVCRGCADEARSLGLAVTPLSEPADREEVNHQDAA